MSFRRLLDRTVTIVPRVVTGTDARGNDVLGDGAPIEDVPAARELLSGDEELQARDQQVETWIYFLPTKKDDGTAVTLTGYDRIVDGDERFEIRGRVEEVTRRRTGVLHHYEATVYRIEG